MTKKVMLINATDPEEIRVATVSEGVLDGFDIEFIHNEKIKGNIYKAKVVRVDTSLQAAFVHYGANKNGFLPIGELPRDLVSPDGRRGRIQDLLQRDKEIMLQAVREELGSKGAMLTAQISLPGRYLVLTPGNPVNGISRKIEGREEREYFKQLIDELDIPKNMGVIVRTASLGVTRDDFQRDLEYLLDVYKEVQTRYKHRPGPGIVWQEDDVVTRTLRDGFSSDMEEVWVDDLDTFQQAQQFFRRTMPQHAHVVKHYTGKKPLFSRYQTEEQIDRIYARKVNLPSGGALVLDQTEALVAIDVNSGKTSGEGVEDMALKTNLEAAEELARQLRLRDLAGLVVIDFIDMKREGSIRQVQDRLVECLRDDKARMEVGKINRFGVLVMTRQRIRPSIQHVTHETCPTCQGTGMVKNLDSLILSVVRRLKSILVKESVAEVRVKLAPVIAMALLNQKRRELAAMEDLHDAHVVVLADPGTPYGEMCAEIERREEEPEERPAPPAPRSSEEDETVVLGGDAPISFDKALAEPAKAAAGGFKYDRRDAQRAALDERERLRALFESMKPEDELPEDAEGAAPAAPAEPRSSRRRRGRGAKDRSAAPSPAETSGTEAPTAVSARPDPEATASAPVSAKPEPEPVVPTFTPDLVASLAVPVRRPKPLAATEPLPPEASAPGSKPTAAKRTRGRKAEPEALPEPKVAKPAKKAPGKPVEGTPLPVADPIPAKSVPAKPAQAPKAAKKSETPAKKPAKPRAKAAPKA